MWVSVIVAMVRMVMAWLGLPDLNIGWSVSHEKCLGVIIINIIIERQPFVLLDETNYLLFFWIYRFKLWFQKVYCMFRTIYEFQSDSNSFFSLIDIQSIQMFVLLIKRSHSLSSRSSSSLLIDIFIG